MSSAGRLDDEKFGQPRLRVVTAAEIEGALGLADLLKTVERALVAYTAGRRRLARRVVSIVATIRNSARCRADERLLEDVAAILGCPAAPGPTASGSMSAALLQE
jgi:hypothetical protein